ncbi:hypothetical protein CPB85DRAFT_1430841 [Mucidula mucida]|nr:hypothetical protein CPB85DRAFT_1430841 [Mucidula mucida]
MVATEEDDDFVAKILQKRQELDDMFLPTDTEQLAMINAPIHHPPPSSAALVALVLLARNQDALSVIHLVRPPTALHVLNRADTALVALAQAVNSNILKDTYFLQLFTCGLSAAAPLVNVPTPETGTTGGPSPHKSAKFTNTAASVKEKSEKLEKEKNEMEKDLKLKRDAANKKLKSQEVA